MYQRLIPIALQILRLASLPINDFPLPPSLSAVWPLTNFVTITIPNSVDPSKNKTNK